MENIFSTKERIKILEAVIFKEGSISMVNVSKQLHLSKGLISKYFDILTNAKILKKVNTKFKVTESLLVKGIRILLNLKDIDVKVFKKYKFIKSVGLYGSCAKGENKERSDVDLWLRIEDVNEDELAPLTAELNKKIQNVKALFISPEKIEKLKKEDPVFYHSLVFSSIIIYGDADGLQL